MTSRPSARTSVIFPAAAGVPYTYWAIGRTDRQIYRAAEKNGHLAGPAR